MNKQEKENLQTELEAIELDISEKIENLNPEDLFAEEGELPALSQSGVATLDYDSQIKDIQNDATMVINNLAELYLGDEKLLNHPYITEKRRKDADYYGKLEFLVKTSQKTLISVMREIDTGQANARMFEVQSMLQKEMRDNIKLSLGSLANIESFYKTIREDLGMPSTPVNPTGEKKDDTSHVDMKEFNEQLDEMMKNGSGSFAIEDEDD